MLVPAMESAAETARRASCATRIRGTIVIATTYAHDHNAKLPSGVRNGYGNYNDEQGNSYGSRTEHVVFVPGGMMDVLQQYGGAGVRASAKQANQYNDFLT